MTEEEKPSSSATELMRSIRQNPADPLAVITSALLAIAGALELAQRFNVNADQLAIVIGSVGIIAATIRGLVVARNGRK